MAPYINRINCPSARPPTRAIKEQLLVQYAGIISYHSAARLLSRTGRRCPVQQISLGLGLALMFGVKDFSSGRQTHKVLPTPYRCGCGWDSRRRPHPGKPPMSLMLSSVGGVEGNFQLNSGSGNFAIAGP
jgi:hypothetical protein